MWSWVGRSLSGLCCSRMHSERRKVIFDVLTAELGSSVVTLYIR